MLHRLNLSRYRFRLGRLRLCRRSARADAAGLLATLAFREGCGFCAGLSFFSDGVSAVCVLDSPSFAEESLVSSPGVIFAMGYSGETDPSLVVSLNLLSELHPAKPLVAMITETSATRALTRIDPS